MSESIFSKQHYKAIAKIISHLNLNYNEKFITYLNFADAFQKDNPRFDIDKFLSAIYSVTKNPHKKGGD